MYATADRNHPEHDPGGNNRALQDAREPQLNQSKPVIAAFGHRDGDNARWIANAKKNKNWSFRTTPNVNKLVYYQKKL